MNWKIQFLLLLLAGVYGSFQETPPNLFHLSTNSTINTENKSLFKPIIIPNITKYFVYHNTTDAEDTTKEKESVQQSTFPHTELPKEQTLTENYPDVESTTNKNFLKFSSRYSTEKKEVLKHSEKKEQELGASDENQIPQISDSLEKIDSDNSGNNDIQENREHKLFSDRSDSIDISEEEKEDVHSYFDTNEPEESEVEPTTNEPYQNSAEPTFFRESPNSEESENYETSSSLAEEIDSSEEEETEEKRSLNDYRDDSSKNYHSVQTPLRKIHYRGPHTFREGYDPQKHRTRTENRPLKNHNWSYSRSETKAERDNENEISDGSLDQGIKQELKGKPNLGLELAVEKDETKFERNKKYNYIEERNRGKQKLKNLAIEEDKDHSLPFQHYEVKEEPRYQYRKISPKKSGILSPESKIPESIFKTTSERPLELEISRELTSAFQNHRTLGPVVFNNSLIQKVVKVPAKKTEIFKKEPTRNSFSKELLENEKLDQDNLINKRIQKTIFRDSASSTTQSFNHLEDSEELYNAILANIQSVFGMRTQPLKSRGGGSRRSDVNLEESKSLTWSLPFMKRSKVE